jgi:hypothetical protein
MGSCLLGPWNSRETVPVHFFASFPDEAIALFVIRWSSPPLKSSADEAAAPESTFDL